LRALRVLALTLVAAASLAGIGYLMRDALLRGLLYFPMPLSGVTPAVAGLAFEDMSFRAEDGVELHGWWIPAARQRAGRPAVHLLLCHGNAGSIENRLIHARSLVDAGVDVLLFDYRGYGRSQGRPSEAGTYLDARAARQALLARTGIDPGRIFYLGESLGGGVALELALAHPPRGLVLQSTFTSIREMARFHYPFVPQTLVPDAYPNLARVRDLRAPLLVLHGDADDIVPLAAGQALHAAAPEPKTLLLLRGLGHNDLVSGAGAEYGRMISEWARGL
jgi:fermentation-respiration switch protein FrsA (DUF1100 family)